ncbi:MAG: hypothetical protein ABI895_20295 [Deltaproteobacteria bacterium]
MIGRYRIVRGARSADEPLPDGQRQDTRKHTRHILRPSAELVARFLAQPSEPAFAAFRAGYLRLLEERFRQDRGPFDALRDAARSTDVFLGCNCPTAKQPDVRRCHTYLALGFLAQRYPELQVRWP